MAPISILTFSGYYLPGYKAGGPIRTLSNMVEHLGDDFEFKIVARDRDFQDESPYTGIRQDQWNRVGKADVYYCSPNNRTIRDFKKIITSTPHDLLYLNSFFNPRFTIIPLLLRKFRLISSQPTIIAPRGELAKTALSQKRFKKRLFYVLARTIGLYKELVWQASSIHEERHIREKIGRCEYIRIAPNLPPASAHPDTKNERQEKCPGLLNAIYLSRVTPIKNLQFAIESLFHVRGRVKFDIYGPVDNQDYWTKCQKAIGDLPDNIIVRYLGYVPHEKVHDTLKQYDLFFQPTKGENFGHAILEAMSSGCPVLISDQTPWIDLAENGAGWDISLSEMSSFVNVLQRCVDMDEPEMNELRRTTLEYAQQFNQDESVIVKNRRLFAQSFAGNRDGIFQEEGI